MIKTYSAYDENGIFTGYTQCTDEELAMQPKNIIEGFYNHLQYFDLSENLVKSLPPPPSHFHKLDKIEKVWVLDTAGLLTEIRRIRNARLSESDWTQIPNAPVSNKGAWDLYRQLLRDITLQPDLLNLEWPTPPA